MWLKGNLHTHTTLSDGDLPPEEVCRSYADQGYHFISITDHERYFGQEDLRHASGRKAAPKHSECILPPVHSFISADAPNVILETVKRAEKENATILRLYECHNQRAKVTVTVNLPFKRVYECDLMERNLGPASEIQDQHTFSFEMKFFEIKTFKLGS